MRGKRENLLMIERLGVNTDWAREEQSGLHQVAQTAGGRSSGRSGGVPSLLGRPRRHLAVVPPPTGQHRRIEGRCRDGRDLWIRTWLGATGALGTDS